VQQLGATVLAATAGADLTTALAEACDMDGNTDRQWDG
jgi:hypothetical protein